MCLIIVTIKGGEFFFQTRGGARAECLNKTSREVNAITLFKDQKKMCQILFYQKPSNAVK
jgi:hypothetical protein